ncbi:IS200/IS605 family transposase [Dactylosporangium cerinum]|uniref:IS200/IS605 family transposase n=1 Tax=Dactylosporangium cerinum TaxID=1434730 RepID=A0ABV9VSB7_9ACTN
MDEVRSNNNVVYRRNFHEVWCRNTGGRSPPARSMADSKKIIREVRAERDLPIEAIETMPDHVHLLVVCDPQFGIHRLVKQIKGRSSRLLRAEFPHLKSRLPTLWTNSYFVATTGGATLEIVKHYVENQRNVSSTPLPPHG